MTAGGEVHVLVPAGVHDPGRPSGGNSYDRALCGALAHGGWTVRLIEVAGSWPEAGAAGRDALMVVVGALPDESLVLVDGLVASLQASVLVPACRRLRIVLLMHMPLGLAVDGGQCPREEAVLRAAAAVVTPSDWARSWLLAAYRLHPGRVHVAHPGVAPAPVAAGTADGGALICVGAVTPAKGQDVLLAALSELRDLRWRCTCIGSEAVSPEYAARLRCDARKHQLDRRFVLAGAVVGNDLSRQYADSDVLVLPSRAETFGMVVTEALARGLPVIASDVGGLPEALGVAAGGTPPGLLVPPGDAPSLADALRGWLRHEGSRTSLRAAALERRGHLTRWSETADRVGRVLREVAT